MPENLWPAWSATTILHGLGAFAGALVNTLSKEQKTLGSFFVNLLVSSFAGFMFGLLAIHFFGQNENIIMMASGCGGYVGKEGLDFVLKRILLKFAKSTIDEITALDNIKK